MQLDPTARAVLDRIAPMAPTLADFDVAEARAAERRIHRMLNPEPSPLARSEQLTVDGPAGAIRCALLLPAGAAGPLPLTLYLHGGGCVLLDPEAYVPLCSHLAALSGSIVLCPDYRLAPEAPFPAALEDAFAVYRWALIHAGEIGADGDRVAVCGDSAGGYLATAVTLAARDAGDAQPRCQVLIYPNTDMAGDWPAYHRPEVAQMRARMALLARLYSGENAADPRASPLLATDHSDLAPAVFLAAGFDPLLDQGRAYADKLAAAGVPVAYAIYPTLPHGFLSMGGVLAAARVARAQTAASLAHWLGGG